MRSIHQFVAGFSNGDAISNEARVLRTVFRKWGCESEIFSEPRRILSELRGEAKDAAAYRAAARADDVVLLHLSIGSVVNDLFGQLPCRRAIKYHNITPAEFFRGIQEEIASQLTRGREQAKALAGKASVVMAVSKFNANELEQWGYKDIRVLPLLLDLEPLRGAPNRGILKKYGDGLTNILFVGRCVPNKRFEDLLAAFHYFQRYVEPASRFIHVGSFAGTERYYALLLTRVRELQLHHVEFAGSLRQDELNACYKSASLFLSMSEHEGFCIPLIESMVHDVPILAYAAAAVPETLDGAGVLFHEKRYDLIAEMMGRLVSDRAFRNAVIDGERACLARFEKRDLAGELRACLAPLL
jgi:L-malate glycosyltransferase